MIKKHFGPVLAKIDSNTRTVTVDWDVRRKQPLGEYSRVQAVAWALDRLAGYQGKGYTIHNLTGVERA